MANSVKLILIAGLAMAVIICSTLTDSASVQHHHHSHHHQNQHQRIARSSSSSEKPATEDAVGPLLDIILVLPSPFPDTALA